MIGRAIEAASSSDRGFPPDKTVKQYNQQLQVGLTSSLRPSIPQFPLQPKIELLLSDRGTVLRTQETK